MIWLATLVLSVQSPDVVGLRANESATVVDASGWTDAAEDGSFLHPRVLDAGTGAPVAGVAIEAWSEAGVEPFRAETRLDSAITGRDGCARLRFVVGKGRADKVRLSKGGYASRVISVSDAFHDEVRLYPAMSLAGRVLDLDGLPVAGALVRTRETCAHAVPATQTRTDAFGRFELQDFPALADGAPEVEVVELHHGALYQLDGGDLRRQGSMHGALDLYVARQRPVVIELVDAHGEPLAGRHVTTNEAPVTESWTDQDGRCTLAPSLYPRTGTYFLGDSPGAHDSFVALFVDGLASRATIGLGEEVERNGRVRVRVDGVNEGERAPPIVLVPSRAPFFELVSGEIAQVPRGSSRIHVGGDFSGWRREVREVDIGESAQEIVFTPRREPRVTVTSTHWKERERLVVQAGDHSDASGEAWKIDEGSIRVPVPAGLPVTIFAEFQDGAVRRAHLPPLEADASVDLDLEVNLIRRGTSVPSTATSGLHFVVLDAEGKRIPDASAVLYSSSSEFDSTSGENGEFTWPLPPHATYRTSFEAPGFTRVHREGITNTSASAQPAKVVLTRRARVELRGNVREVEAGGGEPEATTSGLVLDVAAGPLTLCVQRNEKPALAIDLVLTPGETRVLDVR